MSRFSLAEANALIPRLEAIFAPLQVAYLKVKAIVGPFEEQTIPPDEMERRLHEHPELRGLLAEIKRHIAAIQELGGQFKGLEMGLVDFPGDLDGRPVLLCWQYGEKEIRWWHPEDAGFSSRRPLPGSVDKATLN